MKRLFIAITPNEKILREISLTQGELKRLLPFKGLRWVDPKLMHLTLLFLGDVEEGSVKQLQKSLDIAVAKSSNYELRFEGMGWFGRLPQLRTLWVGAFDRGETEKLYREIFTGMAITAKINSQKFSAHLTIARVSDFVSTMDREEIHRVLEKSKTIKFGDCVVDHVSLIESRLTPAGPVYKILSRHDLG